MYSLVNMVINLKNYTIKNLFNNSYKLFNYILKDNIEISLKLLINTELRMIRLYKNYQFDRMNEYTQILIPAMQESSKSDDGVWVLIMKALGHACEGSGPTSGSCTC